MKDETENVRPLIEEIRAALQGVVAFEILYIDDGSTDDTPSTLRDAMAWAPELRILRRERSCGQSAAVLAGVRHARAPWIATLDGDGQNNPADIPKLLAMRDAAHASDRPSMLCGWRKDRRDTLNKRLSSKIANAVRSSILRDGTPDTGCGLKVFERNLFLQLPSFNHMHRFLPALAKREGAIVVSVPVSHRRRERGKSKYGLWNRLWVGIVDLFGVAWLLRRPTPGETVETPRMPLGDQPR